MAKTLKKSVAQRMLRAAGFEEDGGRTHERWVHHGRRITLTLPRGTHGKVLYGFLAQKVLIYCRGESTSHEKGGSS